MTRSYDVRLQQAAMFFKKASGNIILHLPEGFYNSCSEIRF
jgi:uncharacterized protein (DUF3820 family)